MAKIESGADFDKKANNKTLVKHMNNIDTKPYLFNIPATLYKKVKRKMVEDERNLRDILVEALNKYLSK
jgi:predicted GNAT superfamily acetyltransferase